MRLLDFRFQSSNEMWKLKILTPILFLSAAQYTKLRRFRVHYVDKSVPQADCCQNKLTRWKFISSVTSSPWLTNAVSRARLLESMSLNHHSASKFKSWKQK